MFDKEFLRKGVHGSDGSVWQACQLTSQVLFELDIIGFLDLLADFFLQTFLKLCSSLDGKGRDKELADFHTSRQLIKNALGHNKGLP